MALTSLVSYSARGGYSGRQSEEDAFMWSFPLSMGAAYLERVLKIHHYSLLWLVCRVREGWGQWSSSAVIFSWLDRYQVKYGPKDIFHFRLLPDSLFSHVLSWLGCSVLFHPSTGSQGNLEWQGSSALMSCDSLCLLVYLSTLGRLAVSLSSHFSFRFKKSAWFFSVFGFVLVRIE